MRTNFARLAGCFLVSTAFLFGCLKKGADPHASHPTLASEWITTADWANATVDTLIMEETSPTQYQFSPAALTFTAGKPYILRVINKQGNTKKHYFTGVEFFQAIALRKIQTADAEYKMPYLKALELNDAPTEAKMAELYFVAVKAGSYDFTCTIPGHEQVGMTGTITISGEADLQLDLEVAADFDTTLANDPRISGTDAVWASGAVGYDTISMVEASSTQFAFSPDTLNLTVNKGYRLAINKAAPEVEEHYYSAPAFFKTIVLRKIQDSHAEIKPYYLRAVELRENGSYTELFIVPTVTGIFESVCTLAGHKEAGMIGGIVVE